MIIVTRGQGQTDEPTDRRTGRPTYIATYRAPIAARNERIMTIATHGYRMSI